MFENFNPKRFIVSLVVVVLSIALHEFGHAIAADRCGDDTPRRQGRITLWPDKHFDPIGFLMIVITSATGFGIGWGKPVMVDIFRLKHPRRDAILVAAAGPLMNLLLAVVAGLIWRFSEMTGHGAWLEDDTGSRSIPGMFVYAFLFRNLYLMFFNLLPIAPLDGSKIVSGLLPIDHAIKFDRFMAQWGYMILMLIVFAGGSFLGQILMPPVLTVANLLTGLTWGG